MLQQAVYDLTVCRPHEPPDARFTDQEFDLYRRGYDYALVMAMKTMQHAVVRFEMRMQAKRLDARRKREPR